MGAGWSGEAGCYGVRATITGKILKKDRKEKKKTKQRGLATNHFSLNLQHDDKVTGTIYKNECETISNPLFIGGKAHSQRE